MSLNIKNERVHELAREAARRAGTSQTSAIEAALEQYLRSFDATTAAARSADLDFLLHDVRTRLHAAGASLSTDDLYDDQGLPR
ncbi:type II toxin-antitoxin system VapB family antitoxin [Ruania rhizosphaerae]|uniref:type II toxin-antitoxin system VapB family antitoxin n=1 Tax=Ruania rhizosphaerae TaxID=1840413 RepID=UPI0013584D6E|nr:type II toxin-antitoxin system VapB family antitoxin [Ruania rhizosphaerae]